MPQRYRNKDLLTASEIARYLYCQRAWWYDRNLKTRSYANPVSRKKQWTTSISSILTLCFLAATLLLLLSSLG